MNSLRTTDVEGAVAVTGPTPAKIEVRGVRKRYDANGNVEALSGVDLTVRSGEFVCLVGPSGCGKSTVLRMVAGLHKPSEGEILVHASGARAVPTAMVFQSYNVFPWKTIRANVRFGLEMTGMASAEADERAILWLRKMGLGDFANAYPPALSGGMLQRVAIARAMAVEPEILLMDEPFAALDAQHRRILQDELLTLWQEDRRTVVFVTHSLEEALLLGDRVVVMSARPGHVIAEFEVPFARPRTPDIRGEPAFARLEQEIWNLLREQVGRHAG
ncbi:ABC transporter ATP-binding protein [Hoeflea sp. 108]|jgi:NitT/TauT family transport system ATP-binding protein|uniref:ABC transporter ATP-binding protein n=1 Tax=Hoeflea sp. 108 TaxID=1116369 RepID=UPI00037A8951|nr:ABC transporter ATP-binding protein [Hoeflea sp. 108]